MLPQIKIHPEGVIFIIAFALLSIPCFYWSSKVGYIILFIALYCAFFFRDPDRISPLGDDLVLSPADGVVKKIAKVAPLAELDMKDKEVYRVSIFLSILDVHINRIPIDGRITKLHYHHGQFMNASFDKASDLNERQSVRITANSGREVGLVQIAGLIARRIVCYLNEEQEVAKGERYGLIRFGSRVDIYLPLSADIKVLEGQYMIGGESIIATLK